MAFTLPSKKHLLLAAGLSLVVALSAYYYPREADEDQ
jgi:hypothetical protein